MACPFNTSRVTFMETTTEDEAQAGTNKVSLGQGVTYGQYLQLHKLLDCQKLQSEEQGHRQIIYDIDTVRVLPNNILLVDQITILDTMSPLDFVDFRKYLSPASGFQLLQFRLLENKMGVCCDRRIKVLIFTFCSNRCNVSIYHSINK
ncbi:unnamed protein product [Haemonchus placei]|uniref:MCM_N domain-containing protein n=1 Tax=Haemonchus placei TaxID=6290 RepID=A0A0N4W4K1_HAEPC|nr:unnamed protein product [Haemonchus placei]